MEIELAHTQGFCAGVAMAIDVVEEALKKYGTPLYVRHHIVHNHSVIEDFEKKGVVFVEELDDVPDNQTVIFSAHGVGPKVYEEAEERGLRFIDSTCPLVTKVHREANRFSQRNIHTVLIGHKGHQELIGTSGHVNPDLLHIIEDESDVENLDIPENEQIGYLTQTTLSVSDTSSIIRALKKKFPHIQGAPKAQICYATQNRQDAVLELTETCDVIIICGSPHSSNSNRLKERAANQNIPSYIIDTVKELKIEWLDNKKRVGISSGASVPQSVVSDVVDAIKNSYPEAPVFQKPTIEKDINFPLPTI